MTISKFFAPLLLIFITSHISFANPLTAGNVAFEKNDFSQAYDLYAAAYKDGVKSFELYHNLGTAAAKLGKLDEARLNLEKALIIKPGNRATRNNIKWIKTELSESIAPLPEFLPSVYWNALSAVLNVNSWYCISFFSLVLAAFILWQRLFKEDIGSKGRIQLTLLILLLASSLLFALLGNSRSHQLSSKNNGVIMEEEMQLLGEPEEGAEIVQQLSTGAKVKIDSNLGDWTEVVAEDGAKGWIKKNGMTIIEL